MQLHDTVTVSDIVHLQTYSQFYRLTLAGLMTMTMIARCTRFYSFCCRVYILHIVTVHVNTVFSLLLIKFEPS